MALDSQSIGKKIHFTTRFIAEYLNATTCFIVYVLFKIALFAIIKINKSFSFRTFKFPLKPLLKFLLVLPFIYFEKINKENFDEFLISNILWK